MLNFGLDFKDLYSQEGLEKLDLIFLKHLDKEYPDLYAKLMLARSTPLEGKAESNLILELSLVLEEFIAKLFMIEAGVKELKLKLNELAPIFSVKRLFVQRKASKSYTPEDLGKIQESLSFLEGKKVDPVDELSFAKLVQASSEDSDAMEKLRIYTVWALFSQDGIKKHKKGVLFKQPRKFDQEMLLDLDCSGQTYKKHDDELVSRTGFDHTDHELSNERTLDNANYCIFCHNQEKDSCSHGLKDKVTGKFQTNSAGIKLTGCPLEEKISEMNLLKSEGSVIGALAVAIIDNPMLAATGHRICNDCMKSCIYQKQEPVNIPLVESGVLADVLSLDYGFEIYSLLTKWNPLNFRLPLAKPSIDKKVLVVGLGPAGFTLAHYLLNSGVEVVAIDGLKIEPLPKEISGVALDGTRSDFIPIKDIKSIFEDLGKRKAQGFGGVAEYGITVRWNKNYLTLIRLLLERRSNFRMYGGVRFGGTLNYKDAKELGFDHVALALGAGKPNLPKIKNILAKGVRTASDFLMSLQSGGAALADSLYNLQIRLPIVVVGGGLTAVDAATESLAYYSLQVEKFLKRYEELGDGIFANLDDEEKALALEYINHARMLKGEGVDKVDLLKKWGGVKILYRKRFQDAPAYRLNHEELDKALEEGIEFVENAAPAEVLTDASGSIRALKTEDGREFAAKTMLIAIGTEPNTVLAKEDPNNFALNGNYFAALDDDFRAALPEKSAKPEQTYVIHRVDDDGFAVSFFGDLHPSYAGNVVKAMASAKNGYSKVLKLLAEREANFERDFFSKLDNLLLPRVREVRVLAPRIVEVVLKAQLAARQFEPGQFYRLQNYQANAIKVDGLDLISEPLALTGAWVDKEEGLISTIILEMGGSSDFCKYLTPGEIVVLMGPTGEPTAIPEKETVLLVGGGLGNAVLFSIGKAMRQKGCKVLYFAGYRNASDLFKREEVEAAADVVVWCTDSGSIVPNRKGDKSFNGNLVEALLAYANGGMGEVDIKLQDVDRLLTIGSDKMMQAVAYARHNQLKLYFKEGHVAIGSINSPMQCMMKEICAQCLQRHYDPKTNREEYVFSCANQDQNLDLVDFANLNARLKQNSLQEKVCAQYIESKLRKMK
jgi:NADPH-dependent glutamate synthase beta subunit-like oxidoreductase/NAD(P)H-flavin reductase